MQTGAAPSWRLVKLFQGFYAEADADLLVALLAGSGLPVRRMPAQPLGALAAGFPGVIAVTVWVPAERGDEALELLAEQPQLATPPPVRSLARWTVTWRVASGVFGGLLCFGGSAAAPRFLPWVELIIAAFWLRAAAGVVGWLREQRCFLPDRKVLAATLLLFLAVSGLLGPIWGLAAWLETLLQAAQGPHGRPSPEQADPMALLGCVVLALLAALLVRARRHAPDARRQHR